ncbi:AIPR family protein [Cytobacillus sp. NJ13]|nr:AIPR family protein [Cytobacillus sp. NJ13]
MDIITSNYFKKFLSEQNIEGGHTTTNFEKFVNYITLSTKNINNFNLPSVSIGGGEDGAIDGLAVVLNNRFITDLSELEHLIGSGMEFTVEFYYIQSKTSSSFESKEILNFGSGVVDTFKQEDETKKKMNDSLKEKYKMIRKILDNYEYTLDRKCKLYYVTTGKYVEDENLKSSVENVRNNIKSLDLFTDENIEINMLGSDYIRTQYEMTKVQNSATFELKSKIDLPFIEKVKEAYFAVMPISEYLNIVVDNDNKIRRGIFELNVRDFGGIDENRVNQDIEATILSKDKHSFGLLNNGITIVGKSLTKGQGKYTLKNFYIVNGCQTTNVLYNNREQIDQEMWISVKIVITNEDDIIKNIVKATNNQTEVEEIQLLSMDDYQEKLESYYNSFTEFKQLYYERRDGQYRGNAEVSPIEIVSPEKQVRSFASIFLQEPHNASRFFGKLQDEISKKIFVQDHNPIMYYTSALLNYYIENQFRNDRIGNSYLKFQYHIQLIISQLVWKNEKQPQLNSRKMDEYCILLIKQLIDQEKFNLLIEQAISILDKVIKNLDDLEANKTLSTVNSLLMYIDIELTEVELKNVKYFVNNIDVYLSPFDSMKKDGDLRFNFESRFEELLVFIKKYNMMDFAADLPDFSDIFISVDFDNREERKKYSNMILESIYHLVSNLNKKIEKSRRYEK